MFKLKCLEQLNLLIKINVLGDKKMKIKEILIVVQMSECSASGRFLIWFIENILCTD